MLVWYRLYRDQNMKIFRKLKTVTTISWFQTNILYVIQICEQNAYENAGKNIHNQTHPQSMKSLIILIIRIGKDAHWSTIFLILTLMLYYVIVIEKKYSLSFFNTILSKIYIFLKCKIIYACAFLSKDYVFTPGTGFRFEIPRRLAPGLKKTAVNIKEIPRNARIKFSFFLWNFLFSFYFCHYDDII